MPSSKLTATTAASAIARSIAKSPDTPVILHWQLEAFPISVAKSALRQGQSLVWVVASPERGDFAEASFRAAGLAVRRVMGKNEAAAKATGVRTKYLTENLEPFVMPKVDRAADRHRRGLLTPVEAMRLKARSDLVDSDMGVPEPGVITILSIHRLGHARPVDEIASWPSPLVVFDHLTALNIRWEDLSAEEDGVAAQGDVRSLAGRLRTRDESRHAIPLLTAKSVPQAYLLRDEWACLLLSSYFKLRQRPAAMLATQFNPPKSLRIVVVSSDLGQSKYATPSLLSVLASADESQVVGEAVIGGITPDNLSMTGARPLSRAVLKVSHPSPDLQSLMKRQSGLAERDYVVARARDHVRTAMMAFNPTTRKPELVILSVLDLAKDVANFSGCSVVKLPRWPFAAALTAQSVAPQGSQFLHCVLGALIGLPESLTDGRRAGKVQAIMQAELAADGEGAMATSLARLANGLHSLTRLGERLDLSARPEIFMGQSTAGDKAIAFFNGMLERFLPWAPHETGKDAQRMLQTRLSLYRLYKKYRSNVT